MAMERKGIRGDEWTGIMVALGLHLVLLAVLVTRTAFAEPPSPPVERVTVSLAEEVGLDATAPDPVAESRAAQAPVLADAPVPAPPVDAAPLPQPITRVQPPIPVPNKPATKPDTPQRRRPDRAQAQPAAKPQPKAGGNRLGDNFLDGAGESAKSSETRVPASKIGASAKASLVQAIARRIKPKWQPPSGPDVDKITTFLRFRLNPDGSLAGRPSVVRQTGVNDTNRAQADRHAEQAIRAVQLAAPFDDLPPEYYEAWKLVGPFSFDWRLAQ